MPHLCSRLMQDVVKQVTLRGNVTFDKGFRMPRSEKTRNVTFLPLRGDVIVMSLYRGQGLGGRVASSGPPSMRGWHERWVLEAL